MKIISGGQTGADRAGLEVAKELGFETGGTAPKGYKTENGPDLGLKDFGLVEASTIDYSFRTQRNVQDADGTVIFGDINSVGSQLTKYYCEKFKKPFLLNPGPDALATWVSTCNINVLNVAGNRASKSPDIADKVKQTFREAFANGK